MAAGKQAANRCADNYENVSNIHISRERQREARREKRERPNRKSEEEITEKYLTLSELRPVIRQLKDRKFQVPDGISNGNLKHLGNFATNTLLEIYNLRWREAKLQQIWREANMIPI